MKNEPKATPPYSDEQLAAAAERYRTSNYDPQGTVAQCLDAIYVDACTLANAYLSQLAASRDEERERGKLIDFDFCIAHGAMRERRADGKETHVWKHPQWGMPLCAARYCQVMFNGEAVYVNGMGTSIVTRGQLLDLLRDLGINIGEARDE